MSLVGILSILTGLLVVICFLVWVILIVSGKSVTNSSHSVGSFRTARSTNNQAIEMTA